MPRPLLIAIPIYPRLQSLDAVGPGQVFGSANQMLGREAYRVKFVASKAGAITTSAGFALTAGALHSIPPKSVDTLVVPGGDDKGVRDALADRPFMEWIGAAGKN